MASKATQQADTEVQPQEGAVDAPDTDAAQQAQKLLMKLGKERGYVTWPN